MIKLKNIEIDKYGITFPYNGDVVTYLWIWERKKGQKRFLSHGFLGTFSTLKDIDDMWDWYFRELNDAG